ncbi:hypothetical protein LTR15_003295 [Elasticomyces elasticus]|nr:hypothetical protein LTR15_003295 [Elasticomyces elasticus]
MGLLWLAARGTRRLRGLGCIDGWGRGQAWEGSGEQKDEAEEAESREMDVELPDEEAEDKREDVTRRVGEHADCKFHSDGKEEG